MFVEHKCPPTIWESSLIFWSLHKLFNSTKKYTENIKCLTEGNILTNMWAYLLAMGSSLSLQAAVISLYSWDQLTGTNSTHSGLLLYLSLVLLLLVPINGVSWASINPCNNTTVSQYKQSDGFNKNGYQLRTKKSGIKVSNSSLYCNILH